MSKILRKSDILTASSSHFLRMPPGPTTVLVLGHSFVRRLRDFLVNLSRANGARRITSHTWSNLNLDTQNFTVFYHGIGGLTIQKSYQELYIISELRPDVIFIQLGENDVDKSGASPHDIFSQVTQFTSAILSLCPNTSHVFWGQLLHRPVPRISPSKYSSKIHLVNKLIRAAQSHNIHYWPHKGLWKVPGDLFTSDGVHLNPRGHHKLARSIRGAILRYRALTAVRSAVTVIAVNPTTRYVPS